MAKYPKAYNPLILRLNRLIDAFAKSNDEKDFYLDHVEGFIIFVDLDKDEQDLAALEKEIQAHLSRYALIPKFTFFEIKKIMEGFVNEKVYDIDTKEKLLDIIGSKNPRENFLEFIFDHDNEMEKWQQYYQERSRVRIIEWLRTNEFDFVFEEDLDLAPQLVEKLKMNLFSQKVPKDVNAGRQALVAKAKTYYSNEALNPRPKRGRPPKQAAKVEVETQITNDIYTQVPSVIRRFLFLPESQGFSSVALSEKFDTEEEFLEHIRGVSKEHKSQLKELSEKFASLKQLSNKLSGIDSSLVSDLPTFEEQ